MAMLAIKLARREPPMDGRRSKETGRRKGT
jgi:hypothetical protein